MKPLLLLSADFGSRRHSSAVSPESCVPVLGTQEGPRKVPLTTVCKLIIYYLLFSQLISFFIPTGSGVTTLRRLKSTSIPKLFVTQTY